MSSSHRPRAAIPSLRPRLGQTAKVIVLDPTRRKTRRSRHHIRCQLEDTHLVDLEALDYSRLEDGKAFLLELVTPFVLESAYLDAHGQDIPWWWNANRDELWEREEKLWEQREVYRLQTVDHGQMVAYAGDRPIETAKRGIRRVGSHSKYGFGELRVQPVESSADQHQIAREVATQIE